MRVQRIFSRAAVRAALLWLALSPSFVLAGDWRIDVRFSSEIHPEPYTGRVYLFLSSNNPEPRLAVDWFDPEPILTRDVVDLKPDTDLTFRSDEVGELLRFPQDWEPEQLAGKNVQAVLRFSSWEREANTGAGNGFSAAVKIPAEWDGTHAVTLTVDKLIPPRTFAETETVKLFETSSKLLAQHYGHEVKLSAAVQLPPSYDVDPERRYPVMYIIPGFGGTHLSYRSYLPRYTGSTDEVEFVRVLLDASCPEGHHVYADSANNGPWLSAFVTEFLPAFDARFRTVAAREARFLTGHSSGGWSCLWMMLNAPEQFAGAWSTAPDSVTFSDFSGIDLYADGANVYRDDAGNQRPLGHAGDEILFYYQTFDRMEYALGHGGQLRSFEAVFGSHDKTEPTPAWSRESGAVDPRAVEHWKHYDILKFVERHWEEKQALYRNRLHVHMGDEDTFYLDGSCRLLQQTLAQRGEPEAVRMYPGKNHFSLFSPELLQQINTEMAAHFRKHYTENGLAR